MMHQTGKFKLALIEEPQMQVLELPCVNSTLGVIILLPVGTADVDQVRMCGEDAGVCARTRCVFMKTRCVCACTRCVFMKTRCVCTHTMCV